MANRRLSGVLVVAAYAIVAVALIPACAPKPPPPPPAFQIATEESPGPSFFEDATAKSGIAFTYRNGEDAGHLAIIESLGGGVALFDYDGDGLLDIFLPGGGYYVGQKVLGHPCKLYRNRGGFRFEDATAKAGLDNIAFQYSHGGAAFDYDRDGWTDLLVTGYNRLVLLHNEPDGAGGRRFVEATKKAGLNDALWSTSAAWGDLDGDGYPELYVCHYADWGFDTNHPTDCVYDGPRDVCQPRRFKPLPHALYQNNRDGTFADVSAKAQLRADGRGIGALFVDVDNDGRPDIYAANDTDDNYLYLNRGKRGDLKLFEDGLFTGVARDDRGKANGSMGVHAGDFDRTGSASVLVTNYENELPALYKNRTEKGRVQFNFASAESGIAAVGASYVGWGAGLFDFDRDGWDDLVIVNGHAIRYPTKTDRRQKPIVMLNRDGKFTQSMRGGSYFNEPHNSRGAAFGDLDNDGKIDAVVSHLNEPVAVLQNVAPTENRNWIGIQLAGANRADIVGARVVLETAGGKQAKFALGGGSYGSTNDPRLLFGLGADAKVVAATVHWPSGTAQALANLEPGAYWTVTEGEPAKKVATRNP